MKSVLFYSRFSSFLLFFSISFVTFYFFGIDYEYNLNQQIDRGFISRDAQFFRVYDPSETGRVMIGTVDAAGNYTEEQLGADFADIPDDPSYVMENPIESNGRTRVENLLSASSGDYFAAVHTGLGRYVYFSGQIISPPLVSGRFFSQEECLSREALAVVGSKYKGEFETQNGESYVVIDGVRCHVIGIAGFEEPSTLDSLYFLNLGCVDPQMQLSGRYYIDQSRDLKGVWNQLSEASMKLYRLPLVALTSPTTLVDVIAGGIYLKEYLKIAILGLLAFIYLSILGQTMTTERRKIGIFQVIGVSLRNVFRKIHLPLLLCGVCGILLTLAVGFLLLYIRHFYIPVETLLTLLFSCCLGSLILLFLWMIVFLVSASRIHIREVIQS